MNDFLHIDLPCTDADMEDIEKALGIKFQRINAETILAEKVEVCPLPPPTGEILEIRK